jgi:DNA-binding NarL/FixJ family response regulator
MTRRSPKLGEPLTQREAEIFEAVAAGDGNKRIARRFSLSVRTVETHVYNLRKKLGARDRVQAAVMCSRFAMPSRLASDYEAGHA